MEELLRTYFLRAGYFVVRGVPFVYGGFNITDIDLWLYGRASSISREVTIVDCKNKKTPQAIERIFWVQALKQASKATNAVVATTDKRQEVKDFGKDLGVLVLDGFFLDKLAKSEDPNPPRLSEEEFVSKITKYSLGKIDGDWKGKIISCKSLLSRGLSFDNSNQWLIHAKFYAEQAITKPSQREIALRCLYLICSFIAISVDYSLKELSFLEQDKKIATIKDGFTYGSKGASGMKKILSVAMGLVEEHAENGASVSRQVRSSVELQLSSLNTTIPAEYFAKIEVASTLFAVAKEFENLSMLRDFSLHENASVEVRSMLSCLLDYWGIDRVMFAESMKFA